MTQRKTVEDVLLTIEKHDELWVRLCAILPQYPEEWHLAVFDITANAAPPNWVDLQWSYPRAILHAGVLSGAVVSHWLRSRSMNLGSVTVSLPELVPTDEARVERRSSGSSGVHGRFDWPYEEWSIPFRENVWPNLSQELIGEGATPSFLSPAVAAAAMLRVELSPGGGFDARSAIFRQQYPGARITGIHVGTTSVLVEVDGNGVGGAAVELASNEPGPVAEVPASGPQTIELLTPDGLPMNSWVALKRSGEWIDRRFINYPYARTEADDVDYMIDVVTTVEALVAAGEGAGVEFKVELPENRLNIMKTVAAFANGEGGSILIGVTDDGVIVGASEKDAHPRGLDAIANMVRTWVFPLPDFELALVGVGEPQRPVVVLTVQRGARPPYAAGTTVDSQKYFVRRGGTTFVASPDEVRLIARATPPIEVQGFGGLGDLFKG